MAMLKRTGPLNQPCCRGHDSSETIKLKHGLTTQSAMFTLMKPKISDNIEIEEDANSQSAMLNEMQILD
jgi:hypothetical protein